MRDKSLKTLAFIIKIQSYGESDKILTLFSRDLGKISSIAKGAKNSKKRFLNCLEPFYLIEAILLSKKEEQGLYFLDSAKLISDYSDIHKDYNTLKKTSFLMDLVYYWTADHDPHPEIFDTLQWIMDIMNSKKAQLRHIIFFNVILLKLIGIFPDIKNCKDCGENLINKGAWCENVISGKFLCDRCRNESAKLHLSPGTIRTFNYILEVKLEKMNMLQISSKISQEAINFLRLFNLNHYDKLDLYESHKLIS